MIDIINLWYLTHIQPFFFSDVKCMSKFEKNNFVKKILLR